MRSVMMYLWSFISILLIFAGHSATTESPLPPSPPEEFPTDNKTYKIYSANSPRISETPPHLFPDNDPNYKVIKNETIVKDLMSHSANKTNQNSTKFDLEVPSLVSPALVHNTTTQPSIISQTTAKRMSLNETVESDPDLEQEEIGEDLSKTEDVKKNLTTSLVPRSKIHQEHDHIVRGSGPILQGELAAILAGVFALLAFLSYIGLLTWRRYLEHRYGNRELLINEEDNISISYNDMKNFEL